MFYQRTVSTSVDPSLPHAPHALQHPQHNTLFALPVPPRIQRLYTHVGLGYNPNTMSDPRKTSLQNRTLTTGHFTSANLRGPHCRRLLALHRTDKGVCGRGRRREKTQHSEERIGRGRERDAGSAQLIPGARRQIRTNNPRWRRPRRQVRSAPLSSSCALLMLTRLHFACASTPCAASRRTDAI